MFLSEKKLLLHCCCAPCAVHVAQDLTSDYRVTCFFYNPNIDDPHEYELRREEMERLCNTLGLPLIMGPYNSDGWAGAICGLEDEPEGGKRCLQCFLYRMNITACTAEELGFDLFATTLTVAPVKNHVIINQAGLEASENRRTEYMPSNFKKQDGYKKSVELSKKYGLYRQNYCGCSFSKREMKEKQGG